MPDGVQRQDSRGETGAKRRASVQTERTDGGRVRRTDGRRDQADPNKEGTVVHHDPRSFPTSPGAY